MSGTGRPNGRPLALKGKTADRYAAAKLNDRRREFAEMMAWQGYSADEAAAHVGVTPATGRQWLSMAAVLEHLSTERKAVLAGERPRNIRALVDVRDNSGNAVARVNAARQLEDMALDAGVSERVHERPGYVIAIPPALLAKLHAAGQVPAIPPSMAPAPVIEGQVIDGDERCER